MAINLPLDIPWPKVGNVPFIGSWQKKIARIDAMWAQPCAVNPVFVVVGAFVFVPKLALALGGLDCVDQAFDRIGQPHKRKRKITGNVGDLMPPINACTKTSSLGVTSPGSFFCTYLYRGAQIIQNIGKWAIIIDTALDSIIVSTSFAFRMSGCADPGIPTGTLTMDHSTVALLPAIPLTITTWNVEQCTGGAVCDPATIGMPPGYASSATVSLEQHCGLFPPLPDASWSAEVVDGAVGGTSGILHPTMQPNGNRTLSWADPHFGGTHAHSYRVKMQKDFGVLVMSGHFTATGERGQRLDVPKCGIPQFKDI